MVEQRELPTTPQRFVASSQPRAAVLLPHGLAARDGCALERHPVLDGSRGCPEEHLERTQEALPLDRRTLATTAAPPGAAVCVGEGRITQSKVTPKNQRITRA